VAKSKPKMKVTKKPTLKPLKAANKKAVGKKVAAKKGSVKATPQKAAPKKTLKSVVKKSTGTQKLKTAPVKKVAGKTPTSKTTPKTAPKANAKTSLVKHASAKSQTNFRNFLSPLENRLFVKVIEEPRKTASGLFIPDTARLNDSYVRGEVLAVGPGRKDKHGKLHRVGVDIGETVILTEHAGTSILLEGQNFIFVRESDIVGVLE
jgi:chaperonin GroES